MLRKTSPLLAAIVAVCLLAPPSRAQSLNWGTGGLGGPGTWDTTAANWFNGTTDVPWAAGNTAIFGGTADIVTVNGTIPGINGITFATSGYTLAAGTTPLLTLTAPTITVGSGNTATISAPLAGTVGLTLASGTLNISGIAVGGNTLTGTFTVDAGATLIMGDNLAPNGNATVINGTLDLTAAGVNGAPNRYFTNLTGSGIINSNSSAAGANIRITAGNFAGSIQDGGSTAKRTNLLFQGNGLVNLSGTNTYTGDTLIRSAGTLRLSSAGALPANSLLRLNGGTLELTAAYGDLARPLGATIGTNAIAWEAGSSYIGAIGGDRNVTIGTAGSTLTWGTAPFAPTVLGFSSLASDSRVILNNAINTAGARTIDIANGSAAIDAQITGLYTATGTNTKIGTGTLLMTAGMTGTNNHVQFGTLILDTPSAFTNNFTAFSSIGQVAGNNGTMIIQGATNYTNASDFNIGDVGDSRGTLTINTTGTVRFATMFIGKNATTVGVLNMQAGTLLGTGGAFRMTTNSTGNANAYGFVNQTGGTVDLQNGNEFTIGWAGIGTYNLSGGNVFLTGFNAIGRLDNGTTQAARGLLNISGGLYRVNNQDRFIIGEQGRGWVNITGGEWLGDGVRFGTNVATSLTSQLNILGGTVTTDRLWKDGTFTTATLYLNGGTIRARNATDAAGFLQGLNRTTIGPVGGSIDTNGFDITINQVLTSPSGQGVATIPILTGGAGYVGEPIVQLTGLEGGSARAVITNGVLTAINITNPGNDYAAAPTVTLLGGGPTTAATLGTVTLAPNVVGGNLNKIGNGVLTLGGANTFTSPLVISAGTLAVGLVNDNGIAGPLGAQATAAGLVFNGGTLRYTGGTASSTRTFSIASGQQAFIDVSTAGNVLTLNGDAPVTNQGITKTGVGVLTLAFANTANYTGTTTAAAGILSASGSLAGGVNVTTGRFTPGYQIPDLLTVPTLNLVSSGGGGVDFDFGVGTNDTLTVSVPGGLTLGGTSLNLYQAGGTAAFTTNGTYTVFDYNTSFTGSLFGAFTIANSQPGKVYSIFNNTSATTIELTIGDAVTTAWNVDGGGSWGVGTNWTAGEANSIGAVATFGAILTAPNSPATVTLDGAKVVGNLIFDNAVGSYVITAGTGGSLTINNGIGTPLISAVSGIHTVTAPVTLLNPTNINADTGATLSLFGNIGGAGSVTKLGAGTLVLAGANSYSGSTVIAAGTMEIASAGALGNSPNLTVRNLAGLRVSSTSTFSGPVVLDLNAGTVINISGLENGTGNYGVDVTAGSDFIVGGLFNNTGGSLVKTGAGTLTLTNPGANVLAAGTTGLLSVAIQNGTVTLNGGPSATYAAATELSVGDNTPNSPTLNVLSGTLSVTSFFSVARGTGTTGLTPGVNVTNATITGPVFTTGFNNTVPGYLANPYVNLDSGTLNFNNYVRLSESAGSFTTVGMTGSSTIYAQNDFEIGRGGWAVLKVGAGGTINGNQFFLGGQPNGIGAVWNRGSIVVRSGASTNHFAIGNATGSYGYFLSDTASATTVQEIGVGGAGGGSGVLEIRFGQFTTQQWMTINRTNAANPTSASLIVNGGTLTPNNLAGRFYANQNVAAAQYSTIDVMGAGRIAGGNVADINLNNNSLAAATTVMTVSGGGTVETTRIFAAQAIGFTYVNFNGGTLKATANNAALLDTNLDSVTVFAGGMTVDTNGFSANLGTNTLNTPLGFGIDTIPVLTGGAGYIGRPIVQISDPTGTGASAIANFNEATGVLTGITITSPGSNYSAPTITLVGGGAFSAATLDVPTLVANLNTGGLTKTGAGTLTLSNGNHNYGGNTVITGGTLLVTNTTGSATSTGNVSVGAAGTLGGTGIISGNVTTVTGSNITPGNVGVGNLSVGGLTLAAGSIINQQITDASTLDRITVTNFDGLFINGGGFNLLKTADGTPFFTNGVYNLIAYAGTIGGLGISSLSVLNPQPNKDYTFGANGLFVTLSITTAGGVPNFWNVDADGNWTLGTNWTLLSPPNGVSAIANFGGGGTPITSPRTVTLDANQTVGTVNFDSAVAFNLAGSNTLTLNNGVDPVAVINVALGNHSIGFNMNAVSASTQITVLNPADTLVITGNLSGSSAFSKLGTGVLTLSGTNTVNGGITVGNGTLETTATAANGFTGFTLANGTALRLSGTSNTVAAPVTLAIGGGTPAGINVGVADAPANFTFDTPLGATATISGLVTNASGSLVKTGPGSLTLTNDGANTLGTVGGSSLSVRDGTLVLNSNGSFTSTGELSVGDATPNDNITLTLLNGTLNVTSFISVGRGTGTNGFTQTFNVSGGTVNAQNLFTGFAANTSGYSAKPNINISNNSVVAISGGTRLGESVGAFSTMTVSGSSSLTTTGDTQIGFGGVGIMNISGTAAVVTGGLGLGNGNNAPANTGAGVINQTGGSFSQAGGAGAGDWRIGGFNANDVNAYGSYTLSGGTFSSGGRNIQFGANGIGVLDVRGGAYTSTGGFPVVGRFAGAFGLVNVSSGSFSQNGTGNLLIIGEGGNGVMNVTGGTVNVLGNPGAAGNGGGTGGIRLGHTATGEGTINITGGTVTTTGIAKSNASGFGYAYFSGGTLRAGASNATFMQGLDSALIGPGGLTFDTNGFNATVGQSLEAPIGQGIATIPVLDGGSGYIGQPVVVIGGNVNARPHAVANITAGVVTGITVINPGSNVTTANVFLVGGGATVPATVDNGAITFSTLAATGGLTKNGLGTLTLTNANTYGGPTAINAGTLLVTNTFGSGTGTGPVAVNAAGTLRGTGIVDGAVTVNGTIRAGASVGTLTLNNGMTVTSGGRIYVEVADASTNGAPSTGLSTVSPASNSILAILAGTTSINTGALITVDGSAAVFTPGQYSYRIATGAGDQSLLSITNPSQFTFVGIDAIPASVSLTGNASGDVFVNFTTAIPEPGFLLAGAFGLSLLLRRRK